MAGDNPILDLLAAPLRPDWTVDQLADEVIRVVAQASDESREFEVDAATMSDRQSRRLLRPLLACLATKSAVEAGTSPHLYRGELTFERLGREGSVQVIGRFENTPEKARVAFRVIGPMKDDLRKGRLLEGTARITGGPGVDWREADLAPDQSG